jgi:hypothetical protein
MRRAVSPQNQFVSRDKMLPAPVAGWVTNTNIAEPVKKSAILLENWFPERKSLRLRGGAFRHATVSSTLACESLFSYQSGTTEVLFGATSSAVYNITSPADPLVPPAASISGQTSGRYSTAPFANAAGAVFLTIVNGTDPRQVFDGAAWSTLPAITGVSSSNLSHVWVFANRYFFVEKNTFNAWYLPVDNIGGAATRFSLAGIFQEGGSLLTGGTWSVDAGDGMHDQCVFISSLGEIAVYQGTDPSSAATWLKVGHYNTGTMLGKNALLKVAGDLILMTVDGFVPMSLIQRLDRAALSLNAISQAIEQDWKVEGVARPDNWTVVKWPEKNMTLIALPTYPNEDDICFVANTETGAWAKYRGWDTNCIAAFRGNVYFGSSDGAVRLAESGGSDDGENYICKYIGQFEDWGVQGRQKVALLMRSTFIASNPFTPKISIVTNYSETLPSPPSVASETPGHTWDVGEWDVALWDSSGMTSVTTRWRSVYGQGFALAPVVQVTCGGQNTPDAQLIVNQVRFGLGEMVV